MSRTDAYIRISCDVNGCDVVDEYELCALASRGGWDERYIANRLERDGWMHKDGKDICPSCADEIKAEDE
jgi:hypothetical protein